MTTPATPETKWAESVDPVRPRRKRRLAHPEPKDAREARSEEPDERLVQLEREGIRPGFGLRTADREAGVNEEPKPSAKPPLVSPPPGPRHPQRVDEKARAELELSLIHI